MKCYVLSLHRCGTQSTAQLLRLLGIKTIHWPARHRGVDLQAAIQGRESDLDLLMGVLAPVIARYEAIADVPVPALYRQLHDRSPDAKFILLHRNDRDWVQSVRRFVGERDLAPYERAVYWRYFGQHPRSLAELSDRELAEMHLRHTDEVASFFAKANPKGLLVHRLEDTGSGSAIGAFLGYLGGPPMPTYATGPMPSRLATAVTGKVRRARAALRKMGSGTGRLAATR